MSAGSGFVTTIPVSKLSFSKRKDVIISIFINIIICTFGYKFMSNHNLVGLFICCAISFLAVSLLFLFNMWSVRYHLFTSYKKVKNLYEAKYIYVEADKFYGKSVIVPLEIYELEDNVFVPCFLFQKIRYFNIKNTTTFVEFKYGSEHTLEQLTTLPGIRSQNDAKLLLKKYGDNCIKMEVPSFQELLVERIYSPLFVFQIFCCLLWCLDEYWYYSFFTLFMLVFFESIVVFQQRTNMTFIRNMQSSPSSLYVFREKKWARINDNDLLPGDIISLKHSPNKADKSICPCDALLLHGSCLVDESSLTGESIPQIKEAVEKKFYTEQFDIDRIPRVHLISCGTLILNSTGVKHNITKMVSNPPDNGSIGLCVRTGFSTSKGRLLRTIMYSVNHVPNNNLETALFLAFLSIFACIASAYVWIQGVQDPERNRHKLLLECILILTSVVPPELPIELSLAINSSMVKLFSKNIFCTEPYRIPFAGKLNICCFDKTGTLTEDNLIIEGVVPSDEIQCKRKTVLPLTQLHDMSLGVIVGCHSLTTLNDVIVGDPIEKCALDQLAAKFTGPDSISYDQKQIKIVKRFAFSSKLKRMSTLICLSGENIDKILPLKEEEKLQASHYLYVIKGAPETLQPMFKKISPHYEQIYKSLTRNGYRVLALGYKYLSNFRLDSINSATRDDSEKDVTFSGFLVARCRLKCDTIKSLTEIKYSGHKTTMITGDNALTACYVARVCEMCDYDQQIYMLKSGCQNAGKTDWYWELYTTDDSIVSQSNLPFNSLNHSLPVNSVYCICGDGLRFLLNDPNHKKWLYDNIQSVLVWARVDPEEKEIIIKLFKTLNYATLMCGDGTNDMGALRQSSVGIAILNSPPNNDNKIDGVESSNTYDKSVSNPPLVCRPVLHPKRNTSKNSSRFNQTVDRVNSPKSSKLLKDVFQTIEKEQLNSSPLVKLGDASVAAPFTIKCGKLLSVCDIINQGRCTLVTTLQMFRILAINSLITAYSQSVHYSHGIRMGDYQSTIHALVITFSFFFVSNTEAAPRLTRNIPLSNIFNFYMILSVTLQSLVHLGAMLLISHFALYSEYKGLKFDIDSKFEPNILNSVMFITTITLQVTTFAVNYHGRPFMQSFWKHKKLRNSIILTYLFALVVLFECSPELNENIRIVPINEQIRQSVLFILVGDIIVTMLVNKILYTLIGEKKIK